jgi:hypothetical protein
MRSNPSPARAVRGTLSAAGAALIALLALILLSPALLVESQTLQFGTGWSAAYWSGNTITGSPLFSEFLSGGVNINYGTGSPNPAIPVDNFVAQFSSSQIFNQGRYEFVTTYDDGVRIFIDNILVFDRFNTGPATDQRFSQDLTAGAHALRVEFREATDNAQILFGWQQVSTVPGFTPGFATVTPFGTLPSTPGTAVPTGPQATIAGVRGLALRSGPYVGASFITTLIEGTSYTVLGRNRDEGIYNWYLLQTPTRQGWASGRYLRVNVPDVNQIPVVGSRFDEIGAAADIGARAIPRAVMNVRRRPSPRVEIVGSIPWGGASELIGRTIQAGTNRWLYVRYYTEDGQTVVGWIDARWVTVQGEVFNVPIY